MADVNSNPASAHSGGPSISTTGPHAATDAPESQKSDAANPTGRKVPKGNVASKPGDEQGVPPGE